MWSPGCASSSGSAAQAIIDDLCIDNVTGVRMGMGIRGSFPDIEHPLEQGIIAGNHQPVLPADAAL